MPRNPPRRDDNHEYSGDEDSGRRPKRRRYGGFGEGRDRSFFLPQTIKRPHREPQPQRDPRNVGGMGAPRARARIQPPAPTTGGMVGADLARQGARGFRPEPSETQRYSAGVRAGTRDPLRVLPGAMQLLDFLPQAQMPATPQLADFAGLPPIYPQGTSMDEILIPPPMPRPRVMVTGSRIPR